MLRRGDHAISQLSGDRDPQPPSMRHSISDFLQGILSNGNPEKGMRKTGFEPAPPKRSVP
eukprot:2050940-Rhodomonas_salina.1